MKDRICSGMHFCIEVRDAISNQIIQSGKRNLLVNGKGPVQQKEEGYSVFKWADCDELEIQMMSYGYKKKRFTISLTLPVLEIQCMPEGILYPLCGAFMLSLVLYPDENYILPKGYQRAEVSGEPGKVVRVIRDMEKCILLAEEYQGGVFIQMHVQKGGNIRGGYFRIMEGRGMSGEDFVVAGEQEGSGYRMGKALSRRYPKGSRIYALYSAQVDETGIAEVIVRNSAVFCLHNSI